MKIEATFEMRQGDREWVGSVNEMTVQTIAQAQKWVEQEVRQRMRGGKYGSKSSVEIDVVSLAELGDFADEEGIPTRARSLGQYVPMNDEWEWVDELSN